tara:strand:+ start:56608 stop:57954 length:1347 start_codon:yes stop_codon:yes gene_type:complete
MTPDWTKPVDRQNTRTDAKLWPACLLVAAALSAFFGPLQVSRGGEPMTVGLSWSVMIKLAVSVGVAAISLIGLCCIRSTVRDLLSIPGCLIGGILLLGMPAAISSTSPAALPALLINLAYLVFVAICLRRLPLRQFLMAMLIGMAAALGVAWALFLFLPEYGVYPEMLDDGLIVSRLGGIAHPNSVARSAALALLIVCYLLGINSQTSASTRSLRRQEVVTSSQPRAGLTHVRHKRSRRLTISVVMVATLAVVSILAAKSRTVILGGFIATVVMLIDRVKLRAGLAIASACLLIALVGLLGLAMFGQEDQIVDKLIRSVSKSGSAEELTTGTGRVEIWTFAIGLIAERPLTGHGFGAAAERMVNHSQSAHNAVLHASMISGVGGGILMLLVAGWMLAVFVRTENAFIRAAIAFLFISGLMEDTVLETFPGPATMTWIACCLYPIIPPR